ncbi:Glutamate-rich WD repeat-containing protein 1 [Chamberlinius hualienensis]
MDVDDLQETMSTESEENGNGDDSEAVNEVYIPKKDQPHGKLECDMTAYIMYHQAKTLAPSLSFDLIRESGSASDVNKFPLTMHVVAGTQSAKGRTSHVVVMKMKNMHKVKIEKKEDSDDDDDDDEEEDESNKPDLMAALIKHEGCVNRLRVKELSNRTLASTWSEHGKVHIWDISSALAAVQCPQKLKKFQETEENTTPIFTFSGHQIEGYAMDWSPNVAGQLITGDCKKNIHLWNVREGGQWNVEQRPFVGHTASVEDLQWSPNEANVFCSCSVDRSIRVWDARVSPVKACMLTVGDAHEKDINVISWNKTEPFLVSGGDDGVIKIWDFRQFKQTGSEPVASFKHHYAPITSVEWHPTDSTVFAASGADDQLTIWDLAVEDDDSEVSAPEVMLDLKDIPSQLLFIHQGQTDIKELHWHPQISGALVSTSISGFNIFKTISV